MKLMRIFWDTDMRCRHVGLIKRMKKEKVSWAKINRGDMFVFINSAKTKLIVLTPTDEEKSLGILSSYYHPQNRRIEPLALQYIPAAYGAGEINMDQATKEALIKNLMTKRQVTVGGKSHDKKQKGTYRKTQSVEARL